MSALSNHRARYSHPWNLLRTPRLQCRRSEHKQYTPDRWRAFPPTWNQVCGHWKTRRCPIGRHRARRQLSTLRSGIDGPRLPLFGPHIAIIYKTTEPATRLPATTNILTPHHRGRPLTTPFSTQAVNLSNLGAAISHRRGNHLAIRHALMDWISPVTARSRLQAEGTSK